MAERSPKVFAAMPVGAFSAVTPDALGDEALLVRATCWTAHEERLEVLQREWQQLETALFAKTTARNGDCSRAMAGNSAEARAMRALDVQIEEGFAFLTEEAGAILSLKATTPHAAIAKLEVGLKLQGRFDWRHHARELIDSGIAELKSMLTGPLCVEVAPH